MHLPFFTYTYFHILDHRHLSLKRKKWLYEQLLNLNACKNKPKAGSKTCFLALSCALYFRLNRTEQHIFPQINLWTHEHPSTYHTAFYCFGWRKTILHLLFLYKTQPLHNAILPRLTPHWLCRVEGICRAAMDRWVPWKVSQQLTAILWAREFPRFLTVAPDYQ